MAVTVSGTSITFNDATVQTTAAGAPSTAQVLTATAGASVGAVGTYAMATPSNNTTYAPGATASGGSLVYAAGIAYTTVQCGYYGYTFANSSPRGSALSGTWRCMSLTVGSAGSYSTNGLWLRIS